MLKDGPRRVQRRGLLLAGSCYRNFPRPLRVSVGMAPRKKPEFDSEGVWWIITAAVIFAFCVLAVFAPIAAFLRKHYSQAWISSGELQRIVAEKTTYTPQNVGRRLRELENEGLIEVRYVKNHAHYRAKPTAEQLTQRGLDCLTRYRTARPAMKRA